MPNPNYVERHGLQVAEALARFIEDRALAGLGIDPVRFWAGTAALFERFAPENRALLARRDELQAEIDAWHAARAGQPLNGIGAAIERTAKTYGFRIIENLGSHGVGRALHEAPEHIPGYFDPKDKRVLKDGMVITIEPFLSTKSRHVSETADGWTLVGAPGNLSAQYEHTMIITKGDPIVVTLH